MNLYFDDSDKVSSVSLSRYGAITWFLQSVDYIGVIVDLAGPEDQAGVEHLGRVGEGTVRVVYVFIILRFTHRV